MKKNINLFYLHLTIFYPRILLVLGTNCKASNNQAFTSAPSYHKITLNKFHFNHGSAQRENESEIKRNNLRTQHTLICTFLSPLLTHEPQDFSYKARKNPCDSRVPELPAR